MLNDAAFEIAAFARSVAVNAIGFPLAIAAVKKGDAPVQDSNEEDPFAAFAPKPVTLAIDVMITGYAAACMLLARTIRTPDPETGRNPEHLRKYLKDPAAAIRGLQENSLAKEELRVRAQCQMTGADPSAWLSNFKKAQDEQFNAVAAPIQSQFKTALADVAEVSDEELAETVLSVLADMKKDIAVEIRNAARAMIAAAKKAMENGRYTNISAGIYALADLGKQDKKAANDGEGEAVAA